MDVKTYVNQFNVLGKDEYINCNQISQMLYEAYLNKFIIKYTYKEYEYFREYQERIFDLVENMRELKISTIKLIIEYLNNNDQYIVDNIIMTWCLPRLDNHYSKRIYDNVYRKNINTYNNKLISLIDHKLIKDFCCLTLSKTNYIPIHCIDLLWYYMENISLEFIFYNMENARYIGIIMPDHDSNDIVFGLNMEYLLDMGLGKIVYKNDNKGSFRNLLKQFLINIDVINRVKNLEHGKNYLKQLINIYKNSIKYFDEELPKLPNELFT